MCVFLCLYECVSVCICVCVCVIRAWRCDVWYCLRVILLTPLMTVVLTIGVRGKP